MAEYIYEVRISHGRNHPEWPTFLKNVTRLNAKASGFAGIESVCLLKHHHDSETVLMICTEDMNKHEAVTVREVTRETLRNAHAIWNDLVNDYFLPNGSFPNL